MQKQARPDVYVVPYSKEGFFKQKPWKCVLHVPFNKSMGVTFRSNSNIWKIKIRATTNSFVNYSCSNLSVKTFFSVKIIAKCDNIPISDTLILVSDES